MSAHGNAVPVGDRGQGQVEVARERDRPRRVQHRQVEHEVLTFPRDADPSLRAVPPSLRIAVLQDGAAPGLRLKDAVGDRHRRRGPPGREEPGVDPVPPDGVRGRGQHALEREGASVRPAFPVHGRGFRLDGGAVTRDDVPLALVRPAVSASSRSRRSMARSGAVSIAQSALPQRENRDQAGPARLCRCSVACGCRRPASSASSPTDRGRSASSSTMRPARAVPECGRSDP